MKSEDNLRPIPVRRRRCVFGALCLPMLGIVLAVCGPDRPAATTTTTTASPQPSPTLDSAMEKRFNESRLESANKTLQSEANAKNYC